jgi:hypothetical protein
VSVFSDVTDEVSIYRDRMKFNLSGEASKKDKTLKLEYNGDRSERKTWRGGDTLPLELICAKQLESSFLPISVSVNFPSASNSISMKICLIRSW